YFLAPRLEPKIYQAAQVYGWSFFERPIVIGLLVLTVLSVWAAWKFSPNAAKAYTDDSPHRARNKSPQIIFSACMLGLVIYTFTASLGYSGFGKIFPLVAAIIAFALLMPTMVAILRSTTANAVLCDHEATPPPGHGTYYYVGWIAGMLGVAGLIGFPIACALFITLFVARHVGGSWLRNVSLGVSGIAFLGLMSHFLTLRYPSGVLQSFVEMPWWLGG
ncbi:MAG: hypothetical protein K0U93_30980, partial [Gammaproteobacteria bacterium]|nr:hypothetical protein [Gammaproteobacteria bacterium]